MSSAEASGGEGAAGTPPVIAGEFKLEVVVLAGVGRRPGESVLRRARLADGHRLRPRGAGFRIVQFTPPGSECSIISAKGVTAADPGSYEGL